MNAVILPLTHLDEAKTRQSDHLSPDQRRNLVRAMLCDVARQLDRLRSKVLIVLVTPDREVVDYGLARGWDIVLESRPESETRSVDRASRLLERRGITHALRIPADIPLLEASDLEKLFSLPLTPPAAVLVPSWEGTGTNALLRTPPTAFPSHFGPNSLVRHQKEALRHRAELQLVENPRLALDLDTAEDLSLFLNKGNEGLASYRLVSGWANGEKG